MLQAPEELATSALIQFVPRQVMLDSKSSFAIDIKIKEVESKIKEKEMEKESKKKRKSKSSKHSETLENGSIDPKTLTVDDAGAKGKSRQMLLSSIAAFLESNGFPKTLAVFRSETKLEDDGLKASSIDFEDLFYNFMESRNPEEAAINCEKEKDSQKTDASSKDVIEHVQKKLRKHKKEPDVGTNPSVGEHSSNKNSNGPNNLGNSNDLEKLKSAEDLHVGVKDKKKKKKSLSESLEENADKDDLEISAGVAKESDKNDKSKKKKKHKMSSDGCDENNGSEDHREKFQETVEEKIAELKSLTNLFSSLPAESNAKHKGEKKKKKKTEATSGSLDVKGNKSTEEALEESDSVKEKAAKSENGDGIEKKAHKKRKRLDSEEGASQDDDATMAKESKHVKLEGAENNKECGTPYKPDKSFPDNEQTTVSKKRKTEKSRENSDEAGKTSHREPDPSSQSVQKESGKNQLGNGELEKSGKEGGTASKSQKKEKRSAEPKTVNAFQRVKIDEVKFADERLQDNSYWALDDMGSGYGAKAQEVLGQVRGRDFRHEKTKKKRGTYRGGQIDLQSHSIKFNYSDEE